MTKEIKLKNGMIAIVDDEDYEELNKYNWFIQKQDSNLYARRSIYVGDNKRRTIRMHRQILGLKHKDGMVGDHVNRNTLDNTKSNLRVVTQSKNNQNHGGYSHNTSGCNGVCWNKCNNKWQAYIKVNSEQINLGNYSYIEDAVEARRLGEIEYWGAERRR